MVAKTISYRHRNFILILLAALAAIFFISFDLFIPNATEAAVPSLQAVLGNVITSGTTAESATLAAPIVVGGLADGAPYYYWGQKQTTQAQTKGQQKYCSANPGEQICGVIPDSYNALLPGYYSQNGNTYTGHGINSSCQDNGGIYSTTVPSGQNWDKVHFPPGGANCIGYWVVSSLPFQPWQDWPQDKRQAAANLLNDDDFNSILHSGIAGYLTAGQGLPNGAYVSPSDGQPALFQPGLLTVGSSPLYLSSGDFDEDWGNLLKTADQATAGFGNVVTFGGTNWLREQLYGQIATQDQNGNAYNLGQAIGFGASLFIPLQVEGEALEAFGRSGEIVEGASSRLVPGGGLSAHEAAGGHLLELHKGWDEAELIERIKTRRLRNGASSFPDQATAEAAVSETIDANQSAISSWLSSNSGGEVFEHTASSPVGIHVANENASAIPVSGVRIVLRRASSPLGYRIQTGYPIP